MYGVSSPPSSRSVERDLRGRRERRVTTREHEAETVVGHVILRLELVVALMHADGRFMPVAARRFATQAVDRRGCEQ